MKQDPTDVSTQVIIKDFFILYFKIKFLTFHLYFKFIFRYFYSFTKYNNTSLKYTSYLSYDNYLIMNRNAIMSDLTKKESKSVHSITNQEYIQEMISKSNLNMQSQSLKSMKSIIEVEHEEKNKLLSESSKEIRII